MPPVPQAALSVRARSFRSVSDKARFLMRVTTLPFLRFSMAKTARCFSGGLISVCWVTCWVLDVLSDHPWPLVRLDMSIP